VSPGIYSKIQAPIRRRNHLAHDATVSVHVHLSIRSRARQYAKKGASLSSNFVYAGRKADLTSIEGGAAWCAPIERSLDEAREEYRTIATGCESAMSL
jgi:hypothetical protein